MYSFRLQVTILLVLLSRPQSPTAFNIRAVKMAFFYNYKFQHGEPVNVADPFNLRAAYKILNNSHFWPNLTTTLLIPDYIDPVLTTHNEFSRVYLNSGRRNYLQIVWSNDMIPTNNSVRELAVELADSLLIMFAKGLNIDTFHMVVCTNGHELAGLVVEELYARSKQRNKLKRITSLNQPRFTYNGIYFQWITKYNAEFVDSISTVKDVHLEVSHAHFWPNFGMNHQPGCEKVFLSDIAHECSLERVYELWRESVVNELTGPEFVAYAAKDYEEFKTNGHTGGSVNMGIRCPISARGNYYLNTNKEPPFAMGYTSDAI